MTRVHLQRACLVAAAAFCIEGPACAEMGRMPGNFSISSSGAATYTIPMWSPPGPKGLQPSLALVYNSQAGNGPLGVGWSVASFSQITRCPRVLGQDGEFRAVLADNLDRFCINGNRLRVTSGSSSYGAPGSVYQTELADFSRITANSATGSGPTWFKVEAKNGLIYEYGNTSDSRVT